MTVVDRSMTPDLREKVNTLMRGAMGRPSLAPDDRNPNTADMSDEMNRHEVTARLEASEARVATSVESMRSDMREGFSSVRVEIEKVRADSHKASLDITRWIMATVVTIGLGFVGLILTGAGLYLRYIATQG